MLLLITGCYKKTYTCACTTNIREGNWPPYQTATVVEIKKNTSKKKAELVCKNTAKQMEANTKLVFEGDGYDISTGCALQEK